MNKIQKPIKGLLQLLSPSSKLKGFEKLSFEQEYSGLIQDRRDSKGRLIQSEIEVY